MLKVAVIYFLTICQSLTEWLYDSKPFHLLFAVSIRGCFQSLFCKPYSSDIPIDNNQEELDPVTEVANPLLPHFCSFFPIHRSRKVSFKIRRGPTLK